MQNRIFFISDLHLQAEQPHLTRIFLHFLKTYATTADKLYILGDFFEFWVGDDDHDPFHQSIKASLRLLIQQGTQVFFMPGNRDFLLGNRFATEVGLTLLPDPTVIDLYGTPTLLTHGDSLCSQDINHQRFRRFSQHAITKRLFLLIPLSIRKSIAHKIRTASKNNVGKLTYSQMEVWQPTVEEVMQKSHLTQLIHGHTHRQGIHQFTSADQHLTRFVLGAWHDEGNALVCTPNALPHFIKFC